VHVVCNSCNLSKQWNFKPVLKDSDDGLLHCELLASWTCPSSCRWKRICILCLNPLQSTHSANRCPTYRSTSIHSNPSNQTILFLLTDTIQSTLIHRHSDNTCPIYWPTSIHSNPHTLRQYVPYILIHFIPLQFTHSYNTTCRTYWSNSIPSNQRTQTIRVLPTDPIQSTPINALRQYVSYLLIQFNPFQSTHSENTCPTYWYNSIHSNPQTFRQYVSYLLIHINSLQSTHTLRQHVSYLLIHFIPLQSTHSYNTCRRYWSHSIHSNQPTHIILVLPTDQLHPNPIHTLIQHVSYVLTQFNPSLSTHSGNTCPTYWSTSIHSSLLTLIINLQGSIS